MDVPAGFRGVLHTVDDTAGETHVEMRSPKLVGEGLRWLSVVGVTVRMAHIHHVVLEEYQPQIYAATRDSYHLLPEAMIRSHEVIV